MTKTEETLPPLLGQNAELQLLTGEADDLKKSLDSKQEAVDKKVKEIRARCTHPTFTEERTKQGSFDGINMLVSKTCTECGVKLRRPKGSAWEICEHCWGPMEYQGREPGQGGGIQHYECTKCHHHHTHT